MFSSETKIKVRYVETDQMGIAHHSNYYGWFEVGRGDFIAAAGITYDYIEKRGIMMPVHEAYCRYTTGARYNDDLIIRTSIEELNGVKIIFSYKVIRMTDNKTIAQGSTKHAFVNKDFRVVNIQKKHPDIWEKIFQLSR